MKLIALLILILAITGAAAMGIGCMIAGPSTSVGMLFLLAGASMFVLAIVTFLIGWAVGGKRFTKEFI